MKKEFLCKIWFFLMAFAVALTFVAKYAHAENSFDEKIRDKLAWAPNEQRAADYASDVGLTAAYVLPPIMMLNEDGRDKKLLGFAAVHAINYVVTDRTKIIAGRLRPNGENNRSFFSGHTSTVFTSAGYICDLDRSNCATVVGVASITGYLRIAANKHWISDVLVGAVVGFTTGHQAPIFIRSF